MMLTLTSDRTTTRTNTRWRLGDQNNELRKSGYLSELATGKTASGTVLGKVTTGSKLRPCGVGVVPALAASATQTLSDASMFEVGDEVKVYEDDGTTAIGAARTILSITGNAVVLSTTVTTVNGSIIKRTDGSDVPVGVLLGDSSTFQGSDEHGEAVYGYEPVHYLVKGWIDWNHIKGGSATLKTALALLGFTIEN